MDIFVGNLAFTATEAEVRQLFEGYGTVDTIRRMTDRDTGRPRGFAFVDYADRGRKFKEEVRQFADEERDGTGEQ